MALYSCLFTRFVKLAVFSKANYLSFMMKNLIIRDKQMGDNPLLPPPSLEFEESGARVMMQDIKHRLIPLLLITPYIISIFDVSTVKNIPTAAPMLLSNSLPNHSFFYNNSLLSSIPNTDVNRCIKDSQGIQIFACSRSF